MVTPKYLMVIADASLAGIRDAMIAARMFGVTPTLLRVRETVPVDLPAMEECCKVETFMGMGIYVDSRTPEGKVIVEGVTP